MLRGSNLPNPASHLSRPDLDSQQNDKMTEAQRVLPKGNIPVGFGQGPDLSGNTQQMSGDQSQGNDQARMGFNAQVPYHVPSEGQQGDLGQQGMNQGQQSHRPAGFGHQMGEQEGQQLQGQDVNQQLHHRPHFNLHKSSQEFGGQQQFDRNQANPEFGGQQQMRGQDFGGQPQIGDLQQQEAMQHQQPLQYQPSMQGMQSLEGMQEPNVQQQSNMRGMEQPNMLGQQQQQQPSMEGMQSQMQTLGLDDQRYDATNKGGNPILGGMVGGNQNQGDNNLRMGGDEKARGTTATSAAQGEQHQIKPAGSSRTILIAIDDSTESHEALAYALENVVKSEDNICLSTLGFLPNPSWGDYFKMMTKGTKFGVEKSMELEEKAREMANDRLKRAGETIEKHRANLGEVYHIQHDILAAHKKSVDPRDFILSMCKSRNADLLVVGSSGDSSKGISEHMTRYAPCPVLVVRGLHDNDEHGERHRGVQDHHAQQVPRGVHDQAQMPQGQMLHGQSQMGQSAQQQMGQMGQSAQQQGQIAQQRAEQDTGVQGGLSQAYAKGPDAPINWLVASLAVLSSPAAADGLIDGLNAVLAPSEPNLVKEGSRPATFNGQQVRVPPFTNRVWRIEIPNHLALENVLRLQEWVPTIDFWTEPRVQHHVDVRVPRPGPALTKYLTDAELAHVVVIPDLQRAVDEQNDASPSFDVDHDDQVVMSSTSSASKKFFEKYQPMDAILDYIESLNKTYEGLVEIISIGKTYEGREQTGIRITGTADSALVDVKKEFVFHGAQHAREWIGPAVVTYVATELLEKYGKDKTVTKLMDTFAFTIIPVLNVDGYIYTHTRNRMWRKNRQPNKGTSCIGTDTNRNWGFKWGGGGSSANPCSETYFGDSAFSSPENRNIANYLLSRVPNVVSYIDFHAFSQLWMFAYGADCDLYADPIVEEAALAASKALKAVHGKTFAVGSICNIIYQSAGSSADWAYAVANITFAYGVELRDQGTYGFLLPPRQILPSGEEIFASMKALAQFIMKNAA
ncbi:hypothetical protein HK101_011252 [Irineochytrium annulatum]|nr:hypothetical protein HK101_011252 [Irineochytrium annulatum]